MSESTEVSYRAGLGPMVRQWREMGLAVSVDRSLGAAIGDHEVRVRRLKGPDLGSMMIQAGNEAEPLVLMALREREQRLVIKPEGIIVIGAGHVSAVRDLTHPGTRQSWLEYVGVTIDDAEKWLAVTAGWPRAKVLYFEWLVKRMVEAGIGPVAGAKAVEIAERERVVFSRVPLIAVMLREGIEEDQLRRYLTTAAQLQREGVALSKRTLEVWVQLRPSERRAAFEAFAIAERAMPRS
jgi:hypothetical protein